MPMQIAAIVDGDFVDFANHEVGESRIIFCGECWDILMTNHELGLTGAINRYIERTKDGD